MKKIGLKIGLLGALIAPIGAAIACGTNDSIGIKDIAFVVSTQTNPYFVELVNSAQAEAKAQGYNIHVYNSEDSQIKEDTNIDLIISLGFKTLILNGKDAKQSAASAKKAIDAGMNVIAVDRPLDKSANVWTTVSSDNQSGAKSLAEQALNLFKTKNKSNIEVLHLQGIAGEQNGIDRWNGVSQALAMSQFTGVVDANKIYDARADYDRAKAATETSTQLTAHTNIAWIIADNDEMALGAIAASPSKVGIDPMAKIIVTGFDGSADAIGAVKNGTLFGTVKQQPDLLGKLSVDAAIEASGGQDFANIVENTPIKAAVKVITKSNAF